MRIGVLSRGPKLYSTRRLVEAAKKRGHEVSVVDYLRCYMNITAQRPSVVYRGEPVAFDAVVPRIGASYTFYGTAVVRQFEMMGVYPANESQAISRSRDKLRGMQLLSRSEGVDVPVTGYAHHAGDIDGLIKTVGGAPLVIKLLEGTQGIGVVLAETTKAAESVIAAFRQLDANILVQEFIKEAGGADIRAFVVGRRVVERRRCRHDPLGARAARPRGQFVTGPRGHRDDHRGGRRGIRRGVPREERPPGPDQEPWPWLRRSGSATTTSRPASGPGWNCRSRGFPPGHGSPCPWM
jgi:ribosomal protein S6--L-glutamate ligase